MQDENKTKDQLVRELEAMRQRVAELEVIEAKYQQAQTALKETGKHSYNLFEYSGESIFIIDTATLRFLAVNANAARRLGYSREELLQLTLGDVEIRASDSSYEGVAWESIVSGTMFYECSYRHKDGTEVPVEVSSRIVKYGERGAVLNFVRDITLRKQAEEALRQYAAELEAQNAELDAFAHTVAHNLKTPLNAIIGYADMLADEYDTMPEEDLQHSSQYLIRSARKMNNIIDNLLLLAGVRKQEVDPVPLDMGKIVTEVQHRLAHQIKESQAAIILPDVDAWPAASGYAPWVEEVWVNYVSNAIKYGGQPPRVELGFDESTDQQINKSANPRIGKSANWQIADSQIRFWVRDNGIGLSPEQQVRLFTPFERLDQVGIKGHGLGLSIVRRIIEKLGGQVGVESQGVPGPGSTFYFTLPRVVL